MHLFANKLVYIYKLLEKEKIKPKTIELLEDLFKMYELFYETYYKKDLHSINKLAKLKKEVVKSCDLQVDKGNGRIILQVSMAMRCIEDSIGFLIGYITEETKD